MTVCPDPLRLFLVLMLSHFCCSIRWLALSQAPYSLATKQVQLCHQLPGLTPSQVQLCRSHVELMDTVARAARQVKQTCQETFRDMRWNCSSLDSGPRFLPDLQRGTRETAFVYALSSAAISHAIARACSSGDLRACSCGPVPGQPPHQPGDRWGGCADNLQYGLLVGSRFADAPILVARKSRPQPSRMMHLHNSEVGRQALRATLQLKCKCHGVSGSCSVRTCWRGLQELRDVAIDLKARYLSATRVVHRPGATVGRLVPKDIDVRPLGDSELIYLQSSPDFCTQNDRRGSFGTQNRQCNRTSTGSDGCDLMCCGRGYVPYTESLTERCHCRYHWCCYVTCRTCQRTVERYACK